MAMEYRKQFTSLDPAFMRDLARNLRRYLAPHLERWSSVAQAEGVDEETAHLAIVIESLWIASHLHVGSADLFMRMAQSAIEDAPSSCVRH